MRCELLEKKINYSVFFLLTWDCGFIPEMGDVTDHMCLWKELCNNYVSDP